MASSEKSSTPSAPTAPNGGPPSAPEAVNPAALSIEQLARMLGVPAQKVQEHVDAGALAGPGGRLNLVHYVAWLNRELARSDGD